MTLNTVTGNVSRTHRPCGACGELVENCYHWQRAANRAGSKRRASRREIEAANRARAQRDVAELMRSFGQETP